MPPRPSLPEIFLVALRLGGTSFGGPVAHLAYFREEYVVRRQWLDDTHYADLVALCQFLPGPASSQTGFGVGYLQRGLAGGLLAWIGFTLPSAILMTGFAYGVAAFGNLEGAGWVRGLKAAAVAVVAQAVWTMGRQLCPDWPRRALALAAAALVFFVPSSWCQLAVMSAGAVAGWLWLAPLPGRKTGADSAGAAGPDSAPPAANPPPPAISPASTAPVFLLIFFGLLFALPLWAHQAGNPWLDVLDRFYRAGAMVFGGGHVVLPMLEREVVAPGWVTPDQFLAGYGAVQAMPGPLFSLSAYLGAVLHHDGLAPGGLMGALDGVWALVAIFLPALLLVAGVLPYWQALRQRRGVRLAMSGANAAVVGVLLAALVNPVGTAGITDGRSLALAAAVGVALFSRRIPVWLLVPVAAAAGAVWL